MFRNLKKLNIWKFVFFCFLFSGTLICTNHDIKHAFLNSIETGKTPLAHLAQSNNTPECCKLLSNFTHDVNIYFQTFSGGLLLNFSKDFSKSAFPILLFIILELFLINMFKNHIRNSSSSFRNNYLNLLYSKGILNPKLY
jgi:hypothetical protein